MSGDGVRVARPLFPMEGDGSNPSSPLQLWISEISLKKAKELNRLWHSRLPRYESGFCEKAKICFGAEYGGIYYAVAIWDNPTARMLPQYTWLELKRLAVAPDAPKNTCSRMIRIMTLIIKKKMPKITTLISYQDTEIHNGIIYRASGWIATAYRTVGEWNCKRRYRPPAQSYASKIRWQKEIRQPIASLLGKEE